MTYEQFCFCYEVSRNLEFTYRNQVYTLTYDKDLDGNKNIIFGPRYLGQRYKTFGEFMNSAKVDNHMFKDFLEDIPY